jgi:hypothetical protein
MISRSLSRADGRVGMADIDAARRADRHSWYGCPARTCWHRLSLPHQDETFRPFFPQPLILSSGPANCGASFLPACCAATVDRVALAASRGRKVRHRGKPNARSASWQCRRRAKRSANWATTNAEDRARQWCSPNLRPIRGSDLAPTRIGEGRDLGRLEGCRLLGSGLRNSERTVELFI